MILIKTAIFEKSSAKLKECPPDKHPEFAFIGRSNVGKSSLINMITGRNKLAKISSTPGKTRLINHFLINDRWYLVDLPGFGYAKVSKKDRKKFGVLIEDYVLRRKSLLNLFVLVDSNIPPQNKDLEFINWLGEQGIPFSIVYTKTDRPGQKLLNANLLDFRKKMKENWAELPPEFVTSAKKKTGRDELLAYINELLAL